MRPRTRRRWGVILLAVGILLDLFGSGALAYGAIALSDPLAPLGRIWFDLHVPSLNGFQAGVQRRLHPMLWDPVIVSVLLLPGFVVFALPGALLMIVGIIMLRAPRPQVLRRSPST